MAKIALKKKTVAAAEEVIETPVEETKIDTSFMEEKGTKLTKKISISRKEETPAVEEKKETKKAAPKPTSTKNRSKKYLESVEGVDREMRYKATEAIELAQKGSYTKFPGTIEAHINTAAKNIRGLVSLPYASGKQLRVIAFGKDAADSGAEIVGDDQALEDILKGKLNFDVVVTSPDWMPKLARAARILGPRGMMPNPKNGTIADDLKKAVADIQGGKVEYRTEANGQVIHISVGKVEQPVEEVLSNIKVLFNTIGKSKIKKITLSPTMGPGVKVDLASL